MTSIPKLENFFKCFDHLKFISPLNLKAIDKRIVGLAVAAFIILASTILILNPMLLLSVTSSKMMVGIASSLLGIASIACMFFKYSKHHSNTMDKDSGVWSRKSPVPDDEIAQRIPSDEITEQLRGFNNKQCNGSVLGVYITTNEVSKNVIPILKSASRVENSCHVGFSGWHNFDIMALRQSERGVICDFNPFNKVLIDNTLQVLTTVATRQEFVEQISPFITKNSRELCVNVLNMTEGMDEVEGELIREGSWLASDEGFSHIRELALKGKIVAVTEDIQNTETFRKMAHLLKEKSIAIDTLYLSNIADYVNKSSYHHSVSSLIAQETLVVEVREAEVGEKELFQAVYKGVDFPV